MAGCALAKELHDTGVEVTIVDRQNYTDWSIAAARCLVSPDEIEAKNFTMPLDKIAEFYGAKFVHSAVTEIGENFVELEEGESRLKGDCIVVAIGGQYISTGSIWKPTHTQTTKELRIEAFRAERSRIVSASSIVVAGAGLTGVEVAGEIKSAFPEKKVVLVGTLLHNTTKLVRERTEAALQKLGVVLMEGRVEQDEPIDSIVTTTKGEKIEADLVCKAVGIHFFAGELMDNSLKASLTDTGQVSCRPTLQLDTCDSVFACGEIVCVPEGSFADVRGVLHAHETAKIVAKNVVGILSGKELSVFQWSKKPFNNMVMIVLNPQTGIGALGMPRFMSRVEDFICRTAKAKDFFLSIKAKEFGKNKTWR